MKPHTAAFNNDLGDAPRGGELAIHEDIRTGGGAGLSKMQIWQTHGGGGILPRPFLKPALTISENAVRLPGRGTHHEPSALPLE